MTAPHAQYRSYLLRLWQESPRAAWHASALCVQTSEIVHFADLNGLFAFLSDQMAIGNTAAHADAPEGEVG